MSINLADALNFFTVFFFCLLLLQVVCYVISGKHDWAIFQNMIIRTFFFEGSGAILVFNNNYAKHYLLFFRFDMCRFEQFRYF